MRPPVSDGEMVLSSTKITPPCFSLFFAPGLERRANRPPIIRDRRRCLPLLKIRRLPFGHGKNYHHCKSDFGLASDKERFCTLALVGGF